MCICAKLKQIQLRAIKNTPSLSDKLQKGIQNVYVQCHVACAYRHQCFHFRDCFCLKRQVYEYIRKREISGESQEEYYGYIDSNYHCQRRQ